MARGNFDVEVAGVRALTPRVREYLLRSADGSALPEYAAGAHVALHTVSETHGLIVRHYSLVGGDGLRDDPKTVYRIAVQREEQGRGSAHIHDTFDVGTRLKIGPPVNNFPLGRHDPHVLLVAGGIGITPIFSMARSLQRRGRSYAAFYAGRDAATMAYRSELKDICGDRLECHYSDEAGHPDLVGVLQRQPAGTVVYICGPSRMIEATRAAAAELGWDPGRVRSELFGTGFTGPAKPIDVILKKRNKTIRVGADTSILDALLAENIPLLWDCRRGECGLCPLPVIEADGGIDHRDRYLSDEERASGDTLCICVSRVHGDTLVLDA